jgi:hypothetical protein
VLVKSLCKPDPQKEKAGWNFTACICIWPRLPIIRPYKVRDGHSGILLRQYKNGQNGMPEGEPDNGEAGNILLRQNEEPEGR